MSYARARGRITQDQERRWARTLGSDDIDDMLAAAEFVTQKLQGADKLLYERWLQELFFGEKCGTGKMAEAIRSLRDANIPLATLNYDTLLEQATDLPGITLSDT
ncbi:hypothetical protein EN918_11260, partial [Mesorhizobium sp. M7A.F.Ca.CA.004.05.1.1]